MSSEQPDPFSRARLEMVRTQLEARGIRHERVLDAMRRIPRERFLTGSAARSAARAYSDSALPVARGQTLSQPYMVARMTEALRPEPDHKVLEIGTGTGYQTAVLAHLVSQVWTVEVDATLAREARNRLEEMGLHNINYHVGDGTLGWPEGAPYDGILVTAGAPAIPPPLVAQLHQEGRMVIPVGSRDLQELLVVRLKGGEVRTRSLLECRFVPLVGEEGWRMPPA
jgi:protein-L-isoaspartate(D-aspartate) O-methyltransferase